jgi:cysteine sulfinate desulfinase/cysteine desulfurase-like protein
MLPHLKGPGSGAGGNPSSIHRPGTRARDAVEAARRRLAGVLGCTARRIVFTGSGTEANNLALRGILGHPNTSSSPQTPGPHGPHGPHGHAIHRPGHLITSAVEHPAVLATARDLAARGHRLTILDVDSQATSTPTP